MGFSDFEYKIMTNQELVNKKEKAIAILNVWKVNGINLPDVANIIVEALENYIANIDIELKSN